MKLLKSKKGFTIVEMIIVIAVIAILSSILVPTFSNLIYKANQANDIQIIKQMNVVLKTEEILDEKPLLVNDAKELLIYNGINTFKSSNTDNIFYWIENENKVLLWDKDNNDHSKGEILYPDELKDKYNDTEVVLSDWYDLNSVMNNYAIIENNDNPLELGNKLLEAINNSNDGAVIVLPKNSNVDLNGRGTYIGKYMKDKNISNLTIDLNQSTIDNSKPLNGNGSYYKIEIPTSSTLCLKNGTIKFSDNKNENNQFIVGDKSSLILKKLNITSGNNIVEISGTAKEVIIEECNINANGYGILTQNKDNSNCNIMIKNSTINASHPITITCGKVNIYSSNIIGYKHGIIIREGIVKIEDSKIETLSKDNNKHNYKNYYFNNSEFWKANKDVPSGVIVAGDYYTNNTYKEDVVLTMNNVILKSSDENNIPNILLAAYNGKSNGKNVKVIFDDKCTINKNNIILYGDSYEKNKITITHNGNITVNGKKVTLDSNGKTHIEE